MTESTYRKDIDGLRAVAIIMVVIFHAFPKSLEGGFIGVDVFFVISGYLISKNILLSLQKNTFDIFDFYSRRVKRIFPALIIALSLTLITGSFLLFASEFLLLAKHTLGAIFSISNLILWSESGYFDTSSKLKPLLNLWSLGVEEQFYLIWPLLLTFFSKNRMSLFLLIFVSITLSFLSNILLIESHPSFVFYLPFSRIWELAAGGLLIFFEIYFLAPIVKIRNQTFFANILSALGLLLIICFSFLLKNDTLYPGLFVVAPVCGSFLFIFAGQNAFLNKLLSAKFLVFIGLISYPLYLFHWPLISFANIIYDRDPPESAMWLIIVISFVLSWLTYRYIEYPLKKNWIRKYSSAKINITLCFAMLAVTSFCFLIYQNHGFEGRLKNFEALIQTKKEYRDSLNSTFNDDCRKNRFDIEMCSVTDANSEPTVALIGDSHANHLFPALKNYYTKKGENLILLARSGAAPLLNVSNAEDAKNLDDAFQYVLSNPKIKTVILSSFWSNYYNENGTFVGHSWYKKKIQNNSRKQSQSEIFKNGLDQTFKQLRNNRKNIIFIYDIASVPFSLDRCAIRSNISNFATDKIFKDCVFNKRSAFEDQKHYRNTVDKIRISYPEIVTFDPTHFLCDSKNCSIIKDNRFMYADEHHLSISGAKYLENHFDF